MKLYTSIIVLFSLLVLSCTTHHDKALEQAGENKSELEYVISLYRDNPLKREAAQRLIVNMPLYYGYDSPLLDSIEILLRPLRGYKMNFTIGDKAKERWSIFDFQRLPKAQDVENISAAQLIENIDLAFEQWEKRPWNKDLSFDDFCEFILPYRIGDERLTSWRRSFLNRYGSLLDSLYQGDDVVEACRILNHFITVEEGRIFNSEIPCPHRDALSLLECRVGNCRDDCDLLTYAMRACGIPVARDHILITPLNGASHEWMVVRDNKTGRFLPFGYDGMEPDRDSTATDGRAKGKVHREQFFGKEMIDVTAEYFGNNEAKINVDTDQEEVWLGVFTQGHWLGIDKGKVKKSVACFRNIEPGLIYAPVLDKGVDFTPCGSAFTIDKERKVRIFLPDPSNKDIVRLTRKMPLTPRLQQWMNEDIAGTLIEGAKTRSFNNADTLLFISEGVESNYNYFSLPVNGQEYSYIRLSRPKGRRVHLAELQIFPSINDTKHPIPIEVITEMESRYGPQFLTDNDVLTNLTTGNEINELVLKMSYPSKVEALLIIPHNDDNFVWPGDYYRLQYLDEKGRWRSAGDKMANDSYLEFEAPKGVVFWLRDLTKGKEEQLFFWEDAQQKWQLY